MKLRTKTTYRQSGGYDETTCPGSLPPIGKDPFYRIEFTTDDCWYLGSAVLCKTKYGFWETHIELHPGFRGQGLGIVMYSTLLERARKRGWEVRSSANFSTNAQRLWKSKRLRNKFRIRRVGRRYRVDFQKSI
jgi:GNAT superfamily N-acetyltransferase